MKVKLANQEFPTKEKALSHVKKILEKYNPGEELCLEDFRLIVDLIKLHPKSAEKIGAGIAKIKVFEPESWKHGVGRHKNFLIVRTDSSQDSMSYKKCIYPPKRNPKYDFAEACRQAVVDQIIEFKRQRKKDGRFWSKSEKQFLLESEVHVDHVIPFRELVNEFLETEGIQLDEVVYAKRATRQAEFADSELKRRWQAFHKTKAKLQILSAKENIKKGSKRDV